MTSPTRRFIALDKEGGAIAASGTALVGLRPEPTSRLGHTATIDYRGTLHPTFTCRNHKTPLPRGHRQWLEVKRG